MPKVVEVQLSDSTTVLVQAADDPEKAAALRPASSDVIEKADRTFRDVAEAVRSVATDLLGGLDEMARAPNETTVEFGVSFAGRTRLLIVEGDAAANLKLTLTWKKAGAVSL